MTLEEPDVIMTGVKGSTDDRVTLEDQKSFSPFTNVIYLRMTKSFWNDEKVIVITVNGL